MKAQITRKVFLQASIATTLAGLAGCSDGTETGGDGDGDGDGDGNGSGGSVGDGDGDGAGGSGQSTGGSSGDGDGDGAGGSTGGGDGDGSGGEDTGLSCTEDITVTSSGFQHTHTLTITAAMLDAGVAVSAITTSEAPTAGNHSHDVSLTADEIMTIKNGGVVKLYTCGGGDHEFVISCDPNAPEPVVTSEDDDLDDGEDICRDI